MPPDVPPDTGRLDRVLPMAVMAVMAVGAVEFRTPLVVPVDPEHLAVLTDLVAAADKSSLASYALTPSWYDVPHFSLLNL